MIYGRVKVVALQWVEVVGTEAIDVTTLSRMRPSSVGLASSLGQPEWEVVPLMDVLQIFLRSY